MTENTAVVVPAANSSTGQAADRSKRHAALDLSAIEATILDDCIKGIPGGTSPFPISDIAAKQWNVLRDDMPFPLLVLKASALRHNIEVMKGFLGRQDLSFAPHGKTHMSPQLFDMQLAAGAWGVTVATINQAQVFRRFGAKRILLANQLLGPQHVRYVVQELNRDPEFDFYCFVDSVAGVQQLASLARESAPKRAIKVLLEAGYLGGRTGCRTLPEAQAVVEALRAAQDVLRLAGVSGFEGLMMTDDPEAQDSKKVSGPLGGYLGFITSLLPTLKPSDLLGASEIILSAGGSAYFDVVADVFRSAKCFLPTRIVLRSGCYLTHDARIYAQMQTQRIRRGWEGEFHQALEIWAYVQSLPEPGLAILSMGKRDCPFDIGYPVPQRLYRGLVEHKLVASKIVALNDQHAYLKYEGSADLRVGDKVVSGISHPCTAFDKWRFIPVVSDQYDVTDAILTFF